MKAHDLVERDGRRCASGQQKVYARVQNFFLRPTSTTSVSDITHDHGYSAWLRLAPTRFLFVEAAYVHSIKLNDDAATPTLGFDMRSLFTRPNAQRH
jgi:hypothetical protein